MLSKMFEAKTSSPVVIDEQKCAKLLTLKLKEGFYDLNIYNVKLLCLFVINR